MLHVACMCSNFSSMVAGTQWWLMIACLALSDDGSWHFAAAAMLR
jgi:hypothetical protein